jgi:glycosyltransferase involved in cell wall biosynthesis
MHGAWATGPATAALVASYCCHKSFSFGAHAYDIYQHGGDALLFVKLRACSFVHTTTRAGERRLLEIDPAAESRITLARRGLARLPEPIARKEGQTLGTSDGDPLRLLSVARLVPKKNQAIQLDALRLLRDSGIHAKLKIIGAGPLLSVLKERAEKLNLSDHVEFAGELSHDAVQAAYPEADIFLHTGIVDSRGDRDGLPNVVPEAMSHGLPVVSSPTAGVTEAVEHLVTGLIADPLTADSIATCLQILAQDAALRLELTTNARQWLKEEFIVLNNVRKLARRFRVAIRDYKPPTLPR